MSERQAKQQDKFRSIAILLVAEVTGMGLWFTSAAILPDMAREATIAASRLALLSTAVQAGFVAGALAVAFTGIADRFDPRRVMASWAVLAALANVVLLIAPLGGDLAVAARFSTGFFLAGVYPVGMKIAFGWGLKDRGLLVGLVVGAVSLGNASPFLLAFFGGAEWRITVIAASLLASIGGLIVLAASLGPYHARAPRFDPRTIRVAWTNRTIRRAYLGYFGHMWELYAFSAWIGVAISISYSASLAGDAAISLAKLTTFLAVALGAPACVIAGRYADIIGKAEIALIALGASGIAAILTALTFGGPAWLTMLLAIIWGIAVIPDSAQFSAIVADNAPPELSGSLMTLQSALGFALTIFTVQVTPLAADAFGWPITLAALALGPAFGVTAMLPLRRARAAGPGG